MLKNTRIKLNLDEQIIEGTFRGIIAASNTDILLLGNKKSSLLLSLADVEIKSILLVHTDQISNFGDGLSNKSVSTYFLDKERIVTEIYEPFTKQQAFSILTSIYTKYRGSKPTINTEEFKSIYGGFQYKIENTGISNSKHTTYVRNNEPTTSCMYNQHITNQHKDLKPKLTKNEGITEYLNKVIGGHKYERNYWEQGYSGQLTNNS